MEPNFSHGTVKLNQEIYNQTIEIPVKLDHQLPDYCTGIFKMLQFRTEPHISAFRSSGDQFTIDGNTVVKLIYIDEENGNIKSIKQNIPFSKTLKLDEQLQNTCAIYNIETAYANCKIVSSKKIEIKGALNLNLKLYNQHKQKILQNLSEEETNKTGIHLKKQTVKLPSEKLWNNQQFKISEQIEFATPIEELLDIKINVVENEHKTILNKIISKSTAYITVIYCSTDKKSTITKKTTSSINQILEMPKANENFICNVSYDITSITPKILQDGKILKIDADGLINGYGYLDSTQEIICDAFSTKFNLKPTFKEFETLTLTDTLKENLNIAETFPSVDFAKIVDTNVQISEITSKLVKNHINFNAKLTINAYGIASDETPEIFEKSIPISFTINKNLNDESEKIETQIDILDLDYSMDDNKNLNVKLNFKVNCKISNSKKIKFIDAIEINEKESKTKTNNAALTLFYPQPNDSVWNIAKQFSTCPNEIMQANGLESDVITDEVMLIIPII